MKLSDRQIMAKRGGGDKWSTWDKRIRDAIIFGVGIAGVIHELFIVTDVRPSILIFLASLIGVPFVLSADEKRTEHEEKEAIKEEGI